MITLSEAPRPRGRTPVGLWLLAVFVLSRALNVLIWQIPAVRFVQNDVSYYGYWLWCLFGDGASNPECAAALTGTGVMTEYPLPAVWILQLLYTLGGGLPLWLAWSFVGVGVVTAVGVLWLRKRGYRRVALALVALTMVAAITVWFVAALPHRETAFGTWLPVFALTMLLLDGLVAALLYCHGSVGAAVFWIVFIGACGPIVWFRFDILTAAAVALACLWLIRHPITSGGLIGLGAAIKLWPALLIAPMATPNPLKPGAARWRLIGFVVCGLSLGLASLLVGGWTRSVSPIAWQSARGLQMESVPATPLLILRTFTHDSSWYTKLSEYNAIELFGPGIEPLLRASTILTVASIVLTIALTWRLARNLPHDSPHRTQAILLTVLAVVLATIVANKTLSTQYVQWLAGPLAALLAIDTTEWLRRPRRLLAIGLVVVAVLTQYTYPWATVAIMSAPNGSGFETSTLVARNILLVILAGFAGGLAWRASASASHHHRRGGFAKLATGWRSCCPQHRTVSRKGRVALAAGNDVDT